MHAAKVIAVVALMTAACSDQVGNSIGPDEIRYTSVAGNPGTWQTVVSMNTPRALHRAVLLPGGEVLASGGLTFGVGGPVPTASSEIFNPTSGTWQPAAELSTARSRHGAVVLSDGRVLVAGGRGAFAALASSEVFDAANGTWSPTGRMQDARDNFALVRLRDGRVLAVGGVGNGNNGGDVLKETEIYDPATGTWSSTAAMSRARYNHKAALLPDGRVLVTGGFHPGIAHSAASSAEIYDPATGEWSNVDPMNEQHAVHAFAVLNDGSVLAAGGSTNPTDNFTATSERYDAATGKWQLTTPLPQARGAIDDAVVLNDGSVLIAGGRIQVGDFSMPTATSLLFDPSNGNWESGASMREPRTAPVMTILADGRVLATGGNGRTGISRATEIYER